MVEGWEAFNVLGLEMFREDTNHGVENGWM
jgi:hypothetical protein